jgi:hypothetical protein
MLIERRRSEVEGHHVLAAGQNFEAALPMRVSGGIEHPLPPVS